MRLSFHIDPMIRTVLLATGLWLNVSAQDPAFNSGSNGSDGPLFVVGSLAPIQDFSAVYDSARNEIVVFGGQYYSPFGSADIDHTYTFDGTSWSRKRVETSPPPREEAAMVYDSLREKVVLYGGSFGNDCWLWDGTSWTETLSPDPNTFFNRYAMAFDNARGETILVVKRAFSSTVVETWSFDGATWTEKLPATIPQAHNNMVMSFDETLQQIILLIRVDASSFETWTWNGSDWTQVITDPVNIEVQSGQMAFDGRTGTTVYLGYNGNFTFNGTTWAPLENVPPEFAFGVEHVIYHPGMNALLRMNGYWTTDSGGVQQRNQTWAWRADGTTELLTSGAYTFDMTEKPDGIWNFSTIDIGPNVQIDFINNPANTPLRWLASGDVNIEGSLNLSGKARDELDVYTYRVGLGGLPGPGGYEGATAGPFGTDMHIPGQGPGGGLYAGTVNSANANFSTYGNPWIYPLTGGSGAGNISENVGGGGGGGAVMIASNGTIVIRGQILTNGGSQNNSNSGSGSGGAVLLRANTIQGDGVITGARVRLEAWNREVEDLTVPGVPAYFNSPQVASYTQGPPLLPVDLGANPGRLWVESINGSPPANPRLSSNSQLEVDSILTGGGMSTIVVKGENIPNLAEVSLKISLPNGSVLQPDPVVLTGGQATFNVDLPEGFGAIAATARFPKNLQP
jgi:hypothetical protein